MAATPEPHNLVHRRHWTVGAERFLDRFGVRLLLSAAIVLSLAPLPALERLDVFFFALFGVEFVLRLWAFVARRQEQAPRPRLGELEPPTAVSRRRRNAFALLCFDLLALLSFVPLSLPAEGARWLRVFRLTRMLLLVGYWAPLVRDLWSILARRERARQLVLMGGVVAGLSFGGAVILHHLGSEAIDVTDDGVVDSADRAFASLLWWAFRQVQDPGNMLASPLALPMVIVSLSLTVFGLFLVSFLIGLGTDVVHELMELSRIRPPGMRGHTVIVNISPSTQRLLHELMRYYRKLVPSHRLFSRGLFSSWGIHELGELARKGMASPGYVVVGQAEDPPVFLRQPELAKIIYRKRAEDEEELIARTDLADAKRILLLADPTDDSPDAETIRTLLTLVERVRGGGSEDASIHRRVVIAEILDEANVAAARGALATAERDFRGFVVPTEMLLSLFIASVLRRPELASLLEELLTSQGHEIYTCFFDLPGLGEAFGKVPQLPDDAREALDRLLRSGLAASVAEGCIVPLGFLTYAERVEGDGGFDVHINPQSTSLRELGGCRGFVAIADSFPAVRKFVDTLCEGTSRETTELPASEVPRFQRVPHKPMRKVLVCGFRPGTVYLLEDLLRGMEHTELLVLVESEEARRRARAALLAHSEHVEHDLLEPSARAGAGVDRGRMRLRSRDDGSFAITGRDTESVVHLEVADWMEARHLSALPAGFGHVCGLDAVVFVASAYPGVDKRTTTALLKLEQLFERARQHPHVVAEVVDGKLAIRLEQRKRELDISWLRVFSIQELRSYFLFQSVVVPGFDRVYAELLGAWGQSFVQMVPSTASEFDSAALNPGGPCSFAALALALRDQGVMLTGVELASDGGRTRMAPHTTEPGGRFDLADLRSVWVIARDDVVLCSPL